MAVWGYAQGLIAGGAVAGRFRGGRVHRLAARAVAAGGRLALSVRAAVRRSWARVLIGGVFASGFELLGFHLRRRLGERLGLLDGVGGAAAGGLPGAVARLDRWSAVALQTPGARDLREPIQRSAILKRAERACCRLRARSSRRWRASTRSRRSPARRRTWRRRTRRSLAIPRWQRPRRSVVSRAGHGVRPGRAGIAAGWPADGVVVTNAHVVAGQDDTTVQVGGRGRRARRRGDLVRPAQRPRDSARAGVSGLPALRLNVNADSGTSAAVLGFPQNGPYDVRAGPARQHVHGRSRRTPTGAARCSERSHRSAAWSAPGNSGGPVVDGSGRVSTTIFAAATRRRRTGYGVPDTLVRDALQKARGTVDTGPCAQ